MVLTMTRTSSTADSSLTVEDGRLRLRTPYEPRLVEEIRSIPGRNYHRDDKSNSFPLSSITPVRKLCFDWGIPVPPEIAALPDEQPEVEEQVVPHISIEGDRVAFHFPYDVAVKDALKVAVPAVAWVPSKKIWTCSIANLDDALTFAEAWGFEVPAGLSQRRAEAKAKAEEMHAASMALDADVEVQAAQPLRPFQRAGVSYLVRARRALLCDEQGLGKTVQALSAVVAEHELPAVVVCPNTLKLNWAAEVSKWYPFLTTTVVEGTKSAPIPDADIVILNYDIVAQRAKDVMALNPRSLIADEAHAIKNGQAKYFCPACGEKSQMNWRKCGKCKAQFSEPLEKWTVKRAGGVMHIARGIPKDGLVYLLTGTPITNRPAELIPQLIAIDRIDDFGGRWRFQNRYCPGGNGAANMQELHRRLRETCFIRRTKAQVFEELPALVDSPQILALPPGPYRAYAKIEDDVVEYLANRAAELAAEAGEDPDKAYWEKRMRAEAAEHLIRINVLRTALAGLKYDSMVDWIEGFLESSDEKLIVFAHHIDVVEKLAERFGKAAVKVRGGVKNADRMKAVEAFQNDPTVRLFVGNMAAASEGLTLTAASNVVFLELAWTPATHAQCAARCFGRVNDLHGATAWYLLAPDTVDIEMFQILESKARVVDAVTDGEDPDAQKSVLGDLLVALAKRGLARKAAA